MIISPMPVGHLFLLITVNIFCPYFYLGVIVYCLFAFKVLFYTLAIYRVGFCPNLYTQILTIQRPRSQEKWFYFQ